MDDFFATREELVTAFHEAMKIDVGSKPRQSLIQLREQLLLEECNEVCQELNKMEMTVVQGKPPSKQDWADLLKELCDLQYVLSGTIISFKELNDVDFDEAFELVHYSNMSKLDDEGNPVYREDGKVTKGPNYTPPDLTEVLDYPKR